MSDRDPGASFRELRRHLLRGARSFTHSRDDAEDLVQAAFERWLQQSRSMIAGETEARWLLQAIVKRLAIDRSRRAKRWQLATFDELSYAQAAPAVANVTAGWLRVSTQQLTAALEHCAAHDRETFELHYLQGLGYREIAAQLGIAMGTVATRLHRVRALLRTELERLLAATE